MVDRVMKKRKGYSEGGKVANDDEDVADFEDNDFDVLAKDDDLEFHDTGANSGDEDGEPEKDMDDGMAARAMKKRRKDHNPRPA